MRDGGYDILVKGAGCSYKPGRMFLMEGDGWVRLSWLLVWVWLRLRDRDSSVRGGVFLLGVRVCGEW